jgi:hypothetical protein
MRVLTSFGRTRFAIAAATIALAAIAAIAGARIALAADESLIKIKVAGELPLPAGIPLSVIATDPVLQQVLSQDLQVAGRLASGGAPSVTTITVTLSLRRLVPGMSLNDVAPGDHDAVAVLKAMGVKPVPLPEAPPPQPGSDDQTAAEGNPGLSNDISSYQQQGYEAGPGVGSAPMGPALNPWPMMPWPVPPATAQQRSALPAYVPPNYRPGRALEESDTDGASDTILIARATAGQGSSGLTVIAVGHPGYDKHQARKLIAEEIANAVLH